VSVLAWIVAGGLAMTAVAGVGAVFAFRTISPKTTLVLVALSAGSLLGGALFHMMPAALARTDDNLAPFVWLALGFSMFLVLEQFLHWHHCHGGCDEHTLRPVGAMILIADGLHNFLGGLAIGGAFIADINVGIMAWLAAAAHELPQELGDFGVLVHSGWSKWRALAFNIISASTFLVGGIVAWALSREIDTWVLLPFAAGNFIYIAAADLIPEIKHHPEPARSVLHFFTFVAGAGLLLALRLVIHE
jgi:zinc and cadmium transporter